MNIIGNGNSVYKDGLIKKNRFWRKPYDGYSAMLQLDILRNEHLIVEIDEDVASFFFYTTHIWYNPLSGKYRIFLSDVTESLFNDLKMYIKKHDIKHKEPSGRHSSDYE